MVNVFNELIVSEMSTNIVCNTAILINLGSYNSC